MSNPSEGHLEAGILSLARGSHLVLEDLQPGHEHEYIQVLLRNDGIYQLEYRDNSSELQHQTLTLSTTKVVDAMNGWRTGEHEWLDAFHWSTIADLFE